MAQLKIVSETPVVINGVKYYPHPNGGGLVAETANVNDSAFVALEARVTGNASVYGDARIIGFSVIAGSAVIWRGQVVNNKIIIG